MHLLYDGLRHTSKSAGFPLKQVPVYIAGLRFLRVSNGFVDLSNNGRLLPVVMRSWTRVAGSYGDSCFPITMDVLRHLERLSQIRAHPNHNKLVQWSASSLVFFGFLRVSEYCRKFPPLNAAGALCRADVVFKRLIDETAEN